MYPLLLSVIAGLVISIFFALVKYRDDMNKQEPIGYRFGYIPLYMPIGYQWCQAPHIINTQSKPVRS